MSYCQARFSAFKRIYAVALSKQKEFDNVLSNTVRPDGGIAGRPLGLPICLRDGDRIARPREGVAVSPAGAVVARP